jgi:acyl carrier protein phosphodiesterase
MNYLAHLFLSGDNEHLMIGNFIADHIKGNKISKYSLEIKKGIELHRNIDYYTDHHPEFIKTRERLHENQHKYAGVVADIFYDHFLAVHWRKYADISISNFTNFCYGVLLKNYTLLPSRSKRILPFLMMQNWLVNYKTFDGLNRSFELMARRVKYKSNIHDAVDDLKKDYEAYNEEFLKFFPDMLEFVTKTEPKLKGDI